MGLNASPTQLPPQDNAYLLADEASVVLPPEDELQAAFNESMAVGPLNSTAWWVGART